MIFFNQIESQTFDKKKQDAKANQKLGKSFP